MAHEFENVDLKEINDSTLAGGGSANNLKTASPDGVDNLTNKLFDISDSDIVPNFSGVSIGNKQLEIGSTVQDAVLNMLQHSGLTELIRGVNVNGNVLSVDQYGNSLIGNEVDTNDTIVKITRAASQTAGLYLVHAGTGQLRLTVETDRIPRIEANTSSRGMEIRTGGRDMFKFGGTGGDNHNYNHSFRPMRLGSFDRSTLAAAGYTNCIFYDTLSGKPCFCDGAAFFSLDKTLL